MTPQEINSLREDLEIEILNSIHEFNKAAGVLVSNLYLSHFVDHNDNPVISEVRLVVIIPRSNEVVK